MNNERFRQVEQLYYQALSLSAEARALFLHQACGADEALRREVESLLAAHDQVGNFIAGNAAKGYAKHLGLTPHHQTASEDQPTAQLPNPLPRSIGHYRIISLLGRGGMGEVWLAEDTRLKRRVALKLLPSEFTHDAERVRRFEQEALVISALNHPNIITIHEIGECEAGRFLVMELVAGRTLRALATERVTLDSLIAWGGQLAKALQVAHAAGITHRDLKPENIMVRDDGYVKVLDFGLARLAHKRESLAETESLTATNPGVLLGTVKYMAPEQARGERVTNAADIFALGLVFYELATGVHPFNAATLLGTLQQITSAAPLPPARLNPDVPAVLDALILHMLAKETDARPTAAAVERAFTELQGERNSGQFQRTAKPKHTRHTVGREQERAELRAGFASALNGRGLLLCVAGEPGIGKTTLVEDFLSELSVDGQCTIARGRCSERLAGTEAYLPLLEALESLLQSASNPAAARVLRQIAPTWYAQVAPLVSEDEESARLLTEVKAASQERMKRELGAFLQEVARLRPLILFFDDLHWADVSTIDLLSFLAGKFDALNVLMVVTYRPSDLLLVKHPFLQIKPDLQARGLCRELQLEFLSEAEIAEYLALEFPGHRFPAEFPQLIHAKTEGSPLFMADLVRYLRDRSVIAQTSGAWTLAQTLPDIERELPESVRGMIERKIAQLSEEDRKLLTAASVQGYEFDSAVVAQVLGLDADEVEERLEKLERVFAFVKLTSEAEFPNRRLTLKYRFVHVLYQNALYGAQRATRRAALSAATAQSLLEFYGERSGNIASELAALFEAARDFAKATDYCLLAAQNAAEVFAYRESATLARNGLTALAKLPESVERNQKELLLRLALGGSLTVSEGYGGQEVKAIYSRARELCQGIEEASRLTSVLWGLWLFYHVCGDLRAAREVAEQLLSHGENVQSYEAVVMARVSLGFSLGHLGELSLAFTHLEHEVVDYTLEQAQLIYAGFSPIVSGRCQWVRIHWLMGYPDKASTILQATLDLSRKLSHPHVLAFTCIFASFNHQFRGEPQLAQRQAEEAIALANEHGFADVLGWATIVRSWAVAVQGLKEDVFTLMREMLAAQRSFGSEIVRPYSLTLLAEALSKGGQRTEALAALTEALAVANHTQDRFYEAETLRLRGELLLLEGAAELDVEQCFQQALELTRKQQAKSLELRAAISLARLRRRQGKLTEAWQMLAEIYGWFTEGFDTADLKEAKALLDEL